jgi:hypothetical protein
MLCDCFPILDFTQEELDQFSAAKFPKLEIYLGSDRLVSFVHNVPARDFSRKGSEASMLLYPPILKLFQEGISCC